MQDVQETWNEPPHAPVAAHQMAAEEFSALSHALQQLLAATAGACICSFCGSGSPA